MLGKLVKSRNPEDLRAANRLIRDMVRRVSICTCVHVCTCMYMYVCMCMYVCTYVRTYVCMYIIYRMIREWRS